MSAEFIARTFEKTDYRTPTRFIWSHVRRHRLMGILMILGAFSNAALAAILPIFAGVAVDAVIENRSLSVIGWMTIAIVVSQLVRSVLQFMRNYASEVFAQRIERDVRDELYVSLLGKSMTFHDFQPVGEIMARVTNDVREMNFMMNPGFNLIIGSTMFILMPLVVIPSIHPALLLSYIGFMVAYIVVQYYYIKSLHGVAQQVRVSFGKMNAQLAETLDGIEIVKGTAQEPHEINRFNIAVDTVRDWFIKRGDIEARYLAILLLGLVNVTGFLHAAYLYEQGTIQAGDIVSYIGQLSLLGFPVFTSIFTFSQVASGYAGAERILNIINAQTDLDQNEQGYDAPMQGAIVLTDVDFGYLPDKAVLHKVSLTIQSGQTVAVVGQTGCGKSTLAKLINRTYDVNNGQVAIDGVNVRDWNLAALRSQISIIEQEIFLFSRTIADNIRFGKPEATPAEIKEAAQKAQAHEFIMSFPDGYETIIGQRGVTLSGGQRQRLAIARAFLTDPRILILDDSTSAIDSATEDHIQKAIWAAAKGRTTILITHRLSQIRWADHIIVLKNGQIAAQGSHDTLLESSEAYRRIFAHHEG